MFYHLELMLSSGELVMQKRFNNWFAPTWFYGVVWASEMVNYYTIQLSYQYSHRNMNILKAGVV